MNNDYMRQYMANRRTQRRMKLINLHGGCCITCGSTLQLEFDHRDPKDKKFPLAGYGLDKPWTTILGEANNCDLLCHTHHSEKTIRNGEHGGGHNKIMNYHGTEVGYVQRKCRCQPCRQARYDARVRRGEFSGTHGLRKSKNGAAPGAER